MSDWVTRTESKDLYRRKGDGAELQISSSYVPEQMLRNTSGPGSWVRKLLTEMQAKL